MVRGRIWLRGGSWCVTAAVCGGAAGVAVGRGAGPGGDGSVPWGSGVPGAGFFGSAVYGAVCPGAGCRGAGDRVVVSFGADGVG